VLAWNCGHNNARDNAFINLLQNPEAPACGSKWGRAEPNFSSKRAGHERRAVSATTCSRALTGHRGETPEDFARLPRATRPRGYEPSREPVPSAERTCLATRLGSSANLRSPVLDPGAVSNRDNKTGEMTATHRKQSSRVISNRDKKEGCKTRLESILVAPDRASSCKRTCRDEESLLSASGIDTSAKRPRCPFLISIFPFPASLFHLSFTLFTFPITLAPLKCAPSPTP
jgi:hypothetical protein